MPNHITPKTCIKAERCVLLSLVLALMQPTGRLRVSVMICLLSVHLSWNEVGVKLTHHTYFFIHPGSYTTESNLTCNRWSDLESLKADFVIPICCVFWFRHSIPQVQGIEVSYFYYCSGSVSRTHDIIARSVYILTWTYIGIFGYTTSPLSRGSTHFMVTLHRVYLQNDIYRNTVHYGNSPVIVISVQLYDISVTVYIHRVMPIGLVSLVVCWFDHCGECSQESGPWYCLVLLGQLNSSF